MSVFAGPILYSGDDSIEAVGDGICDVNFDKDNDPVLVGWHGMNELAHGSSRLTMGLTEYREHLILLRIGGVPNAQIPPNILLGISQADSRDSSLFWTPPELLAQEFEPIEQSIRTWVA